MAAGYLPNGRSYCTRQALWNAFLKKSELPNNALIHIVAMLRNVLEPALISAARQDALGK